MGREKWVDSIRFISIEIIFGVHFIAACAPDMSKLWHEGVTGMILCGISGKLAVAMFSVLLGYFAARAGAKADFSMSRYMCRRYIKFSVAIFGILALLAMLSFSMKALGGTNGANMATANFLFGIPALSLKNILLDAFFFEVNVFPLLWCMKDFFLCSIISAAVISISGIENIKRLCGVWAGIILLCCLTGNVWLAIGLLGAALFSVEQIVAEHTKFRKSLILVLILLFVFYKMCAWKFAENNLLHMCQGILCFLLFLVLKTGRIRENRILNNKILAKCGEISFYMYLSHTLINYTWGYYFMNFLLNHMQRRYALIFTFISTNLIVVLVSCFLYQIIENKIIKKLIRKF